MSHLGYYLTYIENQYGISHFFLLKKKCSFLFCFPPRINLLSLFSHLKIHIGDDRSKHKKSVTAH